MSPHLAWAAVASRLSFLAEPGEGSRHDPYPQMALWDFRLSHFLISSSRVCEETRAGIIITATLQVWKLTRWEIVSFSKSCS